MFTVPVSEDISIVVTMSSPLLVLVKLLFNPDVSNKVLLQLAYKQLSAIGLAKILSKALGSTVVAASSVVKVPQIKKILNPPTLAAKVAVSKGLSLEGVSLECIAQLIHVVYNSQNNNPFVNYGETLFLGIQNVAIILLIAYYNARASLKNADNASDKDQIEASLRSLAKPVAVILGVLIFTAKLAPPSLISALQVLTIPVLIVAKVPQIRQNFLLKSTSHLSEITVGANVVGSLIRLFTTVQDFDRLGRDYVLLAGYLSSFALNATLVGQILYYRRAGAQADEEKKNV